MKRVLSVIAICVIANPLLATSALASKHHRMKHRVYKDAAPTTQTEQKATTDLKTATDFKDKAKPAEDTSALSGVSGSMALTTNYVFRGVSQTENLPAVQGGLTYTTPVGIYANVWGSNVKFPGNSGASIELDTIAGWRGSFYEEMFNYDVNIDRYNYPGSTGVAYNEMNALLSYSFIQFGLGYSANVYATHQTGIYYSGLLTFSIPPAYLFNFEDVTLSGGMGHYSLPRAAGNSYDDYIMTLSKKINDTYSIMAQWTGTNGRQHYAPYDGNQLLAAVNASF